MSGECLKEAPNGYIINKDKGIIENCHETCKECLEPYDEKYCTECN